MGRGAAEALVVRDMRIYKIIYYMYPDNDITITIAARNMEEAAAYAKEYRHGSFSIIDMEA